MARAALWLAGLLIGTSPAVAGTYGDTLLADTMARHPGISGITITANGSKGALAARSGAPAATAAALPLLNAMGETIGTIAITFRETGDAAAIARDMSRMIYTADNIGEPDPFVPGTTRSMAGQRLVDAEIAVHPRLVTLAMHVALPGRDNQIIASNFGRIGKAADKDDAHVIADGAVLKEVTNGGNRLAVELPMHDASGRTIGALSTSFSVDASQGPAAAAAEADEVRDEIARRIPTLDALAR